MATPTVGPCEDWTSREELEACPDCPPLPVVGSGDPDPVIAAIDFASQILFNLSARQFSGECVRTVRPCLGSNCGCNGKFFGTNSSWWWGFPSIPIRIDGQWVNCGLCCGDCDLPCVPLPGTVNEVTEVLVDGIPLDPNTDYHVEGFKLLCRTDGKEWPCTQDLTKPATEPDTWQVTYTKGRPITPAMRGFATMLGCQYLNSVCGGDNCLPPNISDLTRDDVTISFEDANEVFADGKTGVREIDLWLASVNPKGSMRRATVVRADDGAFRRRT